MVGSNPGILDVSGGGPWWHAQASVAESASVNAIGARGLSWSAAFFAGCVIEFLVRSVSYDERSGRRTPDASGGSCRVWRSLALRNQRDDPDGAARSPFDLHRQGEHVRARRRQLVEVHEVLDPRHIGRRRNAV